MLSQTAENFQESIKNIIQLLQGLQFTFELIEDEDEEWLILGLIKTEIGQLRLTVYMQKTMSNFVLYLYHPLTVLQPLRLQAAEFITRANYGLPVGNYELDFEDGELRFKIGLPVLTSPITLAQFGQAIDISLKTIVYYHTPLVRTLFDGIKPAVAIQEAESKLLRNSE